MKWISWVAIGSLVLAACGSAEEAGSDEPDTTQDETSGSESSGGGLSTGTVATPEAIVPETVEVGEDYSFEMPEGESTSQVSFEVPAGAVVTLTASAPAGNRGAVALGVGPAGQTLRQVQLAAGGSETLTYITSTDSGGRWNMDLRASSGDVIGFRVEAPLQADGGVAGDAGADAGATTAVELGVSLAGIVGDEDGEDWYAIPLTGGDVVTVTLDMLADAGTGGVSGEIIYNGEGFGFFQVSPGGEESVTQIFSEDQTGEAQLRVAGTGNYAFTIEAGPQTDGGTDGDAGGDLSVAKPASFGVIEGVVGGEDRDDFFVFEAPVDAVFTLEATGPPDQLGPARIAVVYNGNELGRLQIAPGQTDSLSAVLVNDPGAQVFLHVQGLGGAYSVNLTAAPQPDGGDGTGDAGNEQELAKEITAEGTFDGVVRGSGGIDPSDWYRFTATATSTLDITLSAAVGAGNLNMRVYDEERQIGGERANAGGSSTLTIETEAGRDYFIFVQTGTQAAYTLTFG